MRNLLIIDTKGNQVSKGYVRTMAEYVTRLGKDKNTQVVFGTNISITVHEIFNNLVTYVGFKGRFINSDHTQLNPPIDGIVRFDKVYGNDYDKVVVVTNENLDKIKDYRGNVPEHYLPSELVIFTNDAGSYSSKKLHNVKKMERYSLTLLFGESGYTGWYNVIRKISNSVNILAPLNKNNLFTTNNTLQHVLHHVAMNINFRYTEDKVYVKESEKLLKQLLDNMVEINTLLKYGSEKLFNTLDYLRDTIILPHYDEEYVNSKNKFSKNVYSNVAIVLLANLVLTRLYQLIEEHEIDRNTFVLAKWLKDYINIENDLSTPVYLYIDSYLKYYKPDYVDDEYIIEDGHIVNKKM